MTVIVALVSDDMVYMGADRGAFTDAAEYYVSPRPKISIMKLGDDTEVLLGSSGSWRFWDILEESDLSEFILEKNIPKFLKTKFVPFIKDILEDNDYDAKEEHFELMIGINGELYNIQQDWSVMTLPKHGHAIGAGAVPAISSLITINNITHNETPEFILRVALEVSEQVSMLVRGPFDILSI